MSEDTQYGNDFNRAAAQLLVDRYFHFDVEGWTPDLEFQEAYGAANPYDNFSAVAGDLMEYEKKPAFLYRMMETAYQAARPGFKRRPQFQKSGTCVGQMAKNGADFLMARAALLRGIKIPGRSAVCGTYAGSRVEVGGGRIRGDGSNGSWAVKFMLDWGVLLQEHVPMLPQDSIDEDERLAVKWGAPGQGVPSEYEEKAKAFPMKSSSRCRNFDEAAAAIRNGYPVFCCSTLLPARQRDSHGFSRYSRGGGHATLWIGYRPEDKGPEGILDLNSWGDFYTGGSYPDDMPKDATWRNRESVDAACASGDCHIISDLEGFDRNEKWVNSRF